MRELCWHQPALHYESHEQGRLKSAPQTNTSDRARSWIHQVAAGDMLEEPYPDAGLITNLKSRLPRVVGACHHDRKWLNIFREFGSKLTAFIGPFCTVKPGGIPPSRVRLSTFACKQRGRDSETRSALLATIVGTAKAGEERRKPDANAFRPIEAIAATVRECGERPAGTSDTL